MILNCHIVIGINRNGKPVAKRVTRGKPFLESDEAVLHLEMTLPDDLFDAPLFTVEVSKRQVEVAVEALDVEE